MALATRPALSHMARPVGKQQLEKCSVVVEEKCLSAFLYDKPCLSSILDIYDKGGSLAGVSYSTKIAKIAELVTGAQESKKIFRTFCVMSFLDRYQDRAIIAEAMEKLDDKISNPKLTMLHQLEEECFQLLMRMGTIENLSSLDADLVCLLCTVCKKHSGIKSPVHKLLLEIGRSVWPYVYRELWDNIFFVNFVCDILEIVGAKLEELYKKNFTFFWKAVHANIIGTGVNTTCYNRLRLMGIVEQRRNNWTMLSIPFYREEYKQFLELRKREVVSFLGYLPSRRKTSLTVKPGRSAADFLKRRLSSTESLEKDEHSSTSSSGDVSDSLSDVFEEVFETEDRGTSPPLDICKTDDVNNVELVSCSTEYSKSNEQDVDNTVQEPRRKIGQELQNEIVVESWNEIGKPQNEIGPEPQNEIVQEILWESNGIVAPADDDLIWNETSSNETSSNETSSNETSSNDYTTTNNRSYTATDNGRNTAASFLFDFQSTLFLEKKTIIVKVPKKYVGRVIGSHGAVIMSIQEESGAKVNFIKDKVVVPQRPSCSMSSIKNLVHNSLGIPLIRSSSEGERKSEEKTEMQEQREDVAEEGEFEIIGTEEAAGKAKRKIESIVQHMRSLESRPSLTRSFSGAPPTQGFKQINRSLSCPIKDWGEDCSGDCAICRKGCYCRAFLLCRLETPSAWIRPEDLSITQDADWREIIVKTKVENIYRKPFKDTAKSCSTDTDPVSVTQ